jgi:D-glycerate 3-kinase
MTNSVTIASDQLEAAIKQEKLPGSYMDIVDNYIAPTADAIANRYEKVESSLVVGINGAQGSGKSTFSHFLKLTLEQKFRLNVVNLSIDDFYLTKAERVALSNAVHPLFNTRGVPGTHDVALAVSLIRAFKAGDNNHRETIPRFAKHLDDRLPRSDWEIVSGKVDIILFEGWCVGATPQSEQELSEPLNELEEKEDLGGFWRRYSNLKLAGEYKILFELLDTLIMLKVPSFESVYKWRAQQELKLTTLLEEQQAEMEEVTIMKKRELMRFIQHYERLTRHMLKLLPNRADLVLNLNNKHEIIHADVNNNEMFAEFL